MKWLLVVPAIWYWWRVYSLSVNPSQFPDPQYAHPVWDRRSNGSLLLGAAIVTALIYLVVGYSWWVLLRRYRDRAVEKLMGNFCTNLIRGVGRADALREARLELRKS